MNNKYTYDEMKSDNFTYKKFIQEIYRYLQTITIEVLHEALKSDDVVREREVLKKVKNGAEQCYISYCEANFELLSEEEMKDKELVRVLSNPRGSFEAVFNYWYKACGEATISALRDLREVKYRSDILSIRFDSEKAISDFKANYFPKDFR